MNKVREQMNTDRDAPYMLAYTLFYAKVLAAEHTEINNQGMVVITPLARQVRRSVELPARNLI